MPLILFTLLINSMMEIIALLFLLRLLTSHAIMSRPRQTAYVTAVCLTITAIVTEVASVVLEPFGAPLRGVCLVANTMGFSCSAALPYVLAVTYSEKLLRRKWLLALPAAIVALTGSLSGRTGWLFSLSPDNVYSRGPLFFIYVLAFFTGLVLLIVVSCRQAIRLCRSEQFSLLVLFFLSLLGISVQILNPQVYSSWLCITLALLLYYSFQRELQFKYDQLTGVLNRASYSKDTGKALPLGTVVLLFDLDNFKSVNDQHGHAAGDECLRMCARILQRCFVGIGPCYRIGGDEFAVVGCGEEAQVAAACQRMLRRVRTQREILPILPGISYGYGYLRPGSTFEAAFQQADREMYRFKARRAEHTIRDTAD